MRRMHVSNPVPTAGPPPPPPPLIKRERPLSLVACTSCCHGDGPSVKVHTHNHCIRMHQCGATILITEAVSPPRLPLGTITSTLALQKKEILE